jgi:hypothetical protein
MVASQSRNQNHAYKAEYLEYEQAARRGQLRFPSPGEATEISRPHGADHLIR